MSLTLTVVAALAFQGGSLPSVADATRGLQRREGLIENFLDTVRGRVLIKLPAPGEEGLVGEYLYTESLGTGLGANDIGLDRGEDGDTQIVRLRVRGPKLVVEAVNLGFRAESADPLERLAAQSSFPTSILWSGNIVGRDLDGSSVADITSFIVRDAHRSARRLDPQGGYSLDEGKSFLRPEGCKSFPENLELEAQLTFSSTRPTRSVGEVAADPNSVSLVQHHSLVKLP